MRKLKLAIYVSLDGVVENPSWTGALLQSKVAARAGELRVPVALHGPPR